MNRKEVEQAPVSVGRTQALRYIDGERLTMAESIQADCFECMGFYKDGRVDCTCKNCPLYPYMEYNPNRRPFVQKKSVEQGQAITEGVK